MAVINVRNATIDDLDFISRCNINMAKETEDRVLDEKTVRAGVKAVLEDPSLGFYLVAEPAGHAGGQLMVTFEWSDWRDGMFWWIQSVYVEEQHRRNGIFKRLYEEVYSQAKRKKNVCGLRLYAMASNHAAISTYQRMGMEQTEYLMFEKQC